MNYSNYTLYSCLFLILSFMLNYQQFYKGFRRVSYVVHRVVSLSLLSCLCVVFFFDKLDESQED